MGYSLLHHLDQEIKTELFHILQNINKSTKRGLILGHIWQVRLIYRQVLIDLKITYCFMWACADNFFYIILWDHLCYCFMMLYDFFTDWFELPSMSRHWEQPSHTSCTVIALGKHCITLFKGECGSFNATLQAQEPFTILPYMVWLGEIRCQNFLTLLKTTTITHFAD